MKGLIERRVGAHTDPAVHCSGQRVYVAGESGCQRAVIPPLPPAPPKIRTKENQEVHRRTIAQWKDQLVPRYFQRVELVDLSVLGPNGAVGGARPVIGYGDTWASVWIERPQWGWDNGNKLFIGANYLKAAVGYALKLAQAIRRAAEWAEKAPERFEAAFLNGLRIEQQDNQRELNLRAKRFRLQSEFMPTASRLRECGTNTHISLGDGCSWVRRRGGAL